jgi:hypothetical protein
MRAGLKSVIADADAMDGVSLYSCIAGTHWRRPLVEPPQTASAKLSIVGEQWGAFAGGALSKMLAEFPNYSDN